MFDIGFTELLICMIVALLVLGPERLPGAVRTVGRWVGRARHTVNQFTEQIDREIRAEELKKRIEQEIQKTGLEDVAKQVNDALKAPLPLIGADHLRSPVDSAPTTPPTPQAPATADHEHNLTHRGHSIPADETAVNPAASDKTP